MNLYTLKAQHCSIPSKGLIVSPLNYNDSRPFIPVYIKQVAHRVPFFKATFQADCNAQYKIDNSSGKKTQALYN
jgi:hypothetical protein